MTTRLIDLDRVLEIISTERSRYDDSLSEEHAVIEALDSVAEDIATAFEDRPPVTPARESDKLPTRYQEILCAIAKLAPSYRAQTVPTRALGTGTARHCAALARRGLVRGVQFPHAGFALTEAGRELAARLSVESPTT